MATATKRTARPRVTDLPPHIPSEPLDMSEAPSFGPSNGDAAFDKELADAMPPMAKSKADTNLIIEALKQTYTLIGTISVAFSPVDGLIIVRNAEDLAESWRMILDNDAKLRRRMKSLIQGSGWGTVVTAHVAVAVPLINNHRDKFQHLIRKRQPADATGSSQDAS